MQLTVAIPTYNRNSLLAENLASLLPQLTEECQVRIFDNCSETPVSQTLQPLIDAFPAVKCEVIRNPINVGAYANIMRCFETCETEWLWILGDDDTAMPGAVEIIFDNIQQFPDALFMNYSTTAYPIRSTTSWNGLDGFVQGLDSFSNTLFLSTSIYRFSELTAGVHTGYLFAYSGAPHLALLLPCIGEQGRTCFCAEEIVSQYSPEDPAERWSLAAHALSVGTLFDLPLPNAIRAALAAKVLATFPTTEQVVMQLVLLAVKEHDFHNALFYYDQILTRLYRFDPSLSRKIRRRFYRALLRFPRVGYWFVALAYRVTRKREVSLDLLHDRFARM